MLFDPPRLFYYSFSQLFAVETAANQHISAFFDLSRQIFSFLCFHPGSDSSAPVGGAAKRLRD